MPYNSILPGEVDVAHETQLAALGSKFIVNPNTGAAVRFYKYDPAEVTILPNLAVGDPVGLKDGSETLITADISDSAPGKVVGVLAAVPTAAAPFVFVIVDAENDDPALPAYDLITDGNVTDGAIIIWGDDRVVDPFIDAAAVVQGFLGVAYQADTSTTLSLFRIKTAFA